MRRKLNLTTNEITKYKSRLNLHSGKQVFGMNYFETYAPIVTGFVICIIIIIALLFTLSLRQIDCVQAYPQAPIEADMYMELPHGIEMCHSSSKDHVLMLLSNMYGQKQAGCVWISYLVEKLHSIGFQQSLIDECVFFHDDIIFIVYIDDGIFLGPSDHKLPKIIQEIQRTCLDIEDQGHPADYVGVTITRRKNGYVEFPQRALINAIINDVHL
jgi:hypothetical protein